VVGGHSHGSLLLQAPRTDKLLTAYLLEASILCHSLIIGADLGVSTGNAQKVAGLTAVLAVHQFFEGIGLGMVIADAGAAIPPQKKIAFCLAFCCTTSVGVILGMLFTAPAGPRGDVIAGILDGVTGGMLLQLSFGPIVADEFARPELPAHVKVNMFGLIALGAFSMAVLAIWA
jgi:ZIP Zinc transporter